MPMNEYPNPYAQISGGVGNLGNAIIGALFPDQSIQLKARQALAGAEKDYAGAERERAHAGLYGAQTGLTNEKATDIRGYRAGRNRLSDSFLNGTDAERYAASVLAGDDYLKEIPKANLGYRSTLPGATVENLAPFQIGAGEDYQNTAPGRIFIEGQNTARDKYKADRVYDASRYGTDVGAVTQRRGQDITDSRERSKPVTVSNGGTVIFNPKDIRIPETAVGGVFTAPNTTQPRAGTAGTVKMVAADTKTVGSYLKNIEAEFPGFTLQPAAKNQVIERAMAIMQETGSKDHAGAARQAFDEVFGNAETVGNWNPFTANEVVPGAPKTPVAKAVTQAAPAASAPAAKSKALPKVTSPAQQDALIAEANAAIQNGADPAAVRARLTEMGVKLK